MTACTQINIKEGMPPADEALRLLEKGLRRLKGSGFSCVVVIHGYGSSGKGGTIRTRARHWLKEQEGKHRLQTVIYGEDFTLFNSQARQVKRLYPELAELMSVCNQGVTVVVL
jgi:hypothetical protein